MSKEGYLLRKQVPSESKLELFIQANSGLAPRWLRGLLNRHVGHGTGAPASNMQGSAFCPRCGAVPGFISVPAKDAESVSCQ